MSDDALDQLLREAGEAFRTTHTWTARPLAPEVRRARRHLHLPLAAAATTAAVVVGVVLALPQADHRTPQVGHPTPRSSPARTDVTLDLTAPGAIALDDRWVVVSGADAEQSNGRLEVRPRSDLSQVDTTVRTTFDKGNVTCLALTDDWLLWTDDESIDSDLAPGPPTRWSVWQRNLVTGEQQMLVRGGPTSSVDERPCPVAGRGWAAWRDSGGVTLRDLSAGRSFSYEDDADPLAITPSGLVEVRQRVDTAPSYPGLSVLLRTGPSYQERALLRYEPLGTSAAAGDGTVVVITRDPAADTQDGAFVNVCDLPACRGFRQLRDDPGSAWAVVGDGFVGWTNGATGDAKLLRLDGSPAPSLPQSTGFFGNAKAWRGTFAYTTQEEVMRSPVVLHLLDVTG